MLVSSWTINCLGFVLTGIDIDINVNIGPAGPILADDDDNSDSGLQGIMCLTRSPRHDKEKSLAPRTGNGWLSTG